MKIIVNIDKTKAILAKKEIWGRQIVELKVADIPENLLPILIDNPRACAPDSSTYDFNLTFSADKIKIDEPTLENVIKILKILKSNKENKLKETVKMVKEWMLLPFDDVYNEGCQNAITTPWEIVVYVSKITISIIKGLENYSENSFDELIGAIPELPKFLKALEEQVKKRRAEEQKVLELTQAEARREREELLAKQEMGKKKFVKSLNVVIEELGSDLQKRKWKAGYMKRSEVVKLLINKHAQILIKEGFSILNEEDYESIVRKDTLTDEQFALLDVLKKSLSSLGFVDSKFDICVCEKKKEADDDFYYEEEEEEREVAVEVLLKDRGVNLAYLIAL